MKIFKDRTPLFLTTAARHRWRSHITWAQWRWRRQNGFIKGTTACHKPSTFSDKQAVWQRDWGPRTWRAAAALDWWW